MRPWSPSSWPKRREARRLELTQEGFESERARDLHGEGWSGCLDCLEEALAEGAIA